MCTSIYPSISQFLYSIASSAFDLSTARVRAQVRLSERADLGFIIIANRMALYYSVISWPGLSISSLLIPNHFSIVYPICLLPLLAYTHVVQSHPHLYFGMVALAAQSEHFHLGDPLHTNASALNTTTPSLLMTHDIRGVPSSCQYPGSILL